MKKIILIAALVLSAIWCQAQSIKANAAAIKTASLQPATKEHPYIKKTNVRKIRGAQTGSIHAEPLQFLIYPNPCSDKVMISSNAGWKTAATISFLNVQGKPIYSCQIKAAGEEIKTSFLKAGAYSLLIQAKDEKGKEHTETQQLIKL